MAAELNLHDVTRIEWQGPRRLRGGWHTASLVIHTADDTAPVEVTLFAREADALVPMHPGEVEHVE